MLEKRAAMIAALEDIPLSPSIKLNALRNPLRRMRSIKTNNPEEKVSSGFRIRIRMVPLMTN
jgi:hypothetical protein